MNNPLPEALKAETKFLSGWGRTNPVTSQVVQPSSVEQLQELIRGAPNFRPLIGSSWIPSEEPARQELE